MWRRSSAQPRVVCAPRRRRYNGGLPRPRGASVVPPDSLRGFLPVYAASAEGDSLADLGAVRLGVGKVAAAVSLSDRIARLRPPGVLLFGVAGAYPERHKKGASLRVGDVVVVERDSFGDEGVAVADGFLDVKSLGMPSHDLPAAGPFALDALRSRFAADWLGAPLVTATTVSSCSGVESLSQQIAQRTGADIETMEGAAVAYVCARHGLPLVHVRAVSNLCGERSRGGWDLGRAVMILHDAVTRLLLESDA
jgi:futalosine hydrolase